MIGIMFWLIVIRRNGERLGFLDVSGLHLIDDTGGGHGGRKYDVERLRLTDIVCSFHRGFQ